MLHQKKGRCIMTDLEKVIFECEKNAVPDSEIDLSQIPEITDFSNFKPLNSEYFKPKREQVSIRFYSVLLDHFKQLGKGWQTKVNDFLMQAYLAGKI